MPPTKPTVTTSIYLRSARRATLASGRARGPPPPLQYKTRSRPSQEAPRHSRQRPWKQPSKRPSQGNPERKLTLSDTLKTIKNQNNSLLSPVHIPEEPNGVLNAKHPAAHILANSGIVVQRQLELMNVLVGFEQANKYVILDSHGVQIGFMAEQDNSMGRTMARQMFSTHRSFTTHVFDKHEKEVLRFHRPFALISSRIGVYDPVEVAAGSYSRSRDLITSNPGSLSAQVNNKPSQISPLSLSEMRIIGEARQRWAPLRRKYELFSYNRSPQSKMNLATHQISSGNLPLSSSQQLQVSEGTEGKSSGDFDQFAYVDEPFLAWDFSLLSANARKIGSVNRNWGGFGRELFTDTGVYALRMDAAEQEQDKSQINGSTTAVVPHAQGIGMTLDQRAVMLATAVSIDFDYFSRHSGSAGGMGWMPLWFPGAGGEAAATGEAAEGAGAAEEGSIIRDADVSSTDKAREGAAVGAGSMAGYEAMQKGTGRDGADEPTFAEEFHDEFLDRGGDVERNPEEKRNDHWPPEPDPGSWDGHGGGREISEDGGEGSGGGGASDGGGLGGGGGVDVGGGGDFFDF